MKACFKWALPRRTTAPFPLGAHIGIIRITTALLRLYLEASTDPLLLEVLREYGLILITFDRRTMAMHAGQLTRSGGGHAGVILFRRSVSPMDYGKQSRLVVELWKEAGDWDWSDRIEYLPQS